MVDRRDDPAGSQLRRWIDLFSAAAARDHLGQVNSSFDCSHRQFPRGTDSVDETRGFAVIGDDRSPPVVGATLE